MSPSDGLTRCALRLIAYESWRLLASSLHDWSRKILETNPSRPSLRPRPAVSLPRPRPRPPKNGLEWSRDQDRGLEDYITGCNQRKSRQLRVGQVDQFRSPESRSCESRSPATLPITAFMLQFGISAFNMVVR